MKSKKPSIIYHSVDDLFKFFSDSDEKKLYLSEHIPPEFVFWFDSYFNDGYEVIL